MILNTHFLRCIFSCITIEVGFNVSPVKFLLCLQDKGEVSLCVWRHLPVLRGFSPLSPLYVSPDLKTFHTGTLPGRAIHASKSLYYHFPYRLFIFVFTLPRNTSLFSLLQMFEEAEAILTKLPKPVEEDVAPPAESWSSSPLRSLHSPGPANL